MLLRIGLLAAVGVAILVWFGQPGGSLRLSNAQNGSGLTAVAKPALNGLKTRAAKILD